MARFAFALVFVGIALGFTGHKELKVSEGATAEPVALELAELERGQGIENPHIQLGTHMRMYHELVFQYDEIPGGGEPSDSTQIDHSYFPIVSPEHPYMREMATLIELYGSAEEIPEERLPAFDQYYVLVKTKRFSTYADLPYAEWYEAQTVKGLVINKIDHIDKEQMALLKESFPKLNLSQVWIVEEGRTPSSPTRAYGMLGGGGLLGMAGVVSFFAGRRA